MKKFSRILFAVLLIVTVSFVFYWYEYKPSKIRSDCADKAFSALEKLEDQQITAVTVPLHQYVYENCLHRSGL